MSLPDGLEKMLPVEKIYDDLASPATKEIGSAVRSAVKASRFLLAPIDYLAAQHDRWENFLKRVSDQVPKERLVDAHPQIAGKAIEGLKYLEQESILAELFVNLLARAIDKDRVSEAHPAFASIISQISPDEAFILFTLSKKQYRLVEYASYDTQTNTFGTRVEKLQEFPVAKLAYPQNYQMYASHLHSLNLAGIFQRGNQEAVLMGGRQIGTNIISYAQLTSFGELFAKACMPETIDQFTAQET